MEFYVSYELEMLTTYFCIVQGSAQDNLSGGYTLPKVLLNFINVAFQYFLHSVSGGKISVSGCWSQLLPASVGRTL